MVKENFNSYFNRLFRMGLLTVSNSACRGIWLLDLLIQDSTIIRVHEKLAKKWPAFDHGRLLQE